MLTVIKQQKYMNYLVLFSASLILVSMCIPGMNVIDASCKSQLNRLTSIYTENKEFEELSEKDRKQVISSYQFIIANGKENWIPEYIDKSKFNELKTIDTNYMESNIVNYNSENDIPVDGFKKERRVEISANVYKNNIDLSMFDMYEAEPLNIEIKEGIKNFIAEAMSKENIVDEIIDLNENTSFWIEQLYISYIKETNEIENIILDGYVLMK